MDSFARLPIKLTMLRKKAKCILAFVVTLMFIHSVDSSILPFVLLPLWFFIYRPWKRPEVVMFALASLFFLLQNYFVLKRGAFYFKQRDILLMPFYEPFLWGFYYIAIKRFISEPGSESHRLHWKSFVGLAITSLCFSLSSGPSTVLFVSTLISTGLLIVLFHERYDFYYAACAVVLGFAVEIFGVTTGLWWYPEPDFLGIPYWFATMWISVGLLGRRFLIPLAYWASNLGD